MAVVTSFEANKNVALIPMVVQFTDTSTGSPTRWWWDFGDGEVGSSLQNPTHTYNCKGDYSVTLTSWVDDDIANPVGNITGTLTERLQKGGIEFINEAIAWEAFLLSSFVAQGLTSYSYIYGNRPTSPRLYQYTDRKVTWNLNLTGQTKGEKVLILQYRSRLFNYGLFSCSGVNGWAFWFSNNHLGDIPIFKIKGDNAIPKNHNIQMISSPDLLNEFDHAGENFSIQIKNAKNTIDGSLNSDIITFPCLFQRPLCGCMFPSHSTWTTGLDYQRLGFSCTPPSGSEGNLVKYDIFNLFVKVHSFVSGEIDSHVEVNFITANSPIIARPPISISDIREAYFKDGWKNEKYFYIEQSTANPCIVQFVDIYAEAEDKE